MVNYGHIIPQVHHIISLLYHLFPDPLYPLPLPAARPSNVAAVPCETRISSAGRDEGAVEALGDSMFPGLETEGCSEMQACISQARIVQHLQSVKVSKDYLALL